MRVAALTVSHRSSAARAMRTAKYGSPLGRASTGQSASVECTLVSSAMHIGFAAASNIRWQHLLHTPRTPMTAIQ
ncbi:MAG TPA: hypothetical protein VII35_08705 [Steroidobacteraceae bacterium]